MSQIENLQNEAKAFDEIAETSLVEADKIEKALETNGPQLIAQSQMLSTVNGVVSQILNDLASDDENVKALLSSFANELIQRLNRIREESTANFYRAQGRVLMLRETAKSMTEKSESAKSKIAAVERVEKLAEEGEEVHDNPSARPVGAHPEKISDVRLAKEGEANEDTVEAEEPEE